MERKLTGILSADVEGYSRLMGEDEEATNTIPIVMANASDDPVRQGLECSEMRVINYGRFL